MADGPIAEHGPGEPNRDEAEVKFLKWWGKFCGRSIVSLMDGALNGSALICFTAMVIHDWLRRELKNLPEGRSPYIVPGLTFELKVFIDKTFDDTPGFQGSLFVMRNALADIS